MNISGAVGYTLLKSPNNNYILVFSDIHDGVKYCNDSNENKISTFLKNRKDNFNILLEESTQIEVDLKGLWPNSKHTQELKKLAYESNDINSFDIRPLLLPFSWELIDVDINLGNTILNNYLTLINTFFDKSSLLYTKYIQKELVKIKYLKKKNNLHLLEIFDQYSLFLKQNKNILEKKLLEIKKNNIEILIKINEIISHIMEWYIILLVLNNNKNSIIHAGLSHTENVVKLLKEFYKFEVIENEGLNKLEEVINLNKPTACILLPEHIKNKFNKKFNFFSNYF